MYDYDGKGWRWALGKPLQVEKIEQYGDLSAITGAELSTLASFTPGNERYVGFAGKDVFTRHRGLTHVKYINDNPIRTGGDYYDSIKTTTNGDLVIYDSSATIPLVYYKASSNSVISMPTSSDLAGVEFIKTPSFETEKEDDDEVVIVTKESYENMRNKCKDLDIDTLKTVKNLLTASTITSGISTAGGIANTVMGGISLANNKSEEDKSETNKKLDLATTIVSGVSTVSSGTATATSAVAISKVNDAIDKVKDCKNAINNLIMKID